VSKLTKSMAKAIVEDLFELGREPKHPVSRIQFKSGRLNAETDGGGLCRESLIEQINQSLQHYLNK